ncbi:hypothetical protein [Streptomyces sp. NPDC058653]|uniref:hypothetical protein n=1 Tax=Streptomyces sp. NPDC058653 TaxID=3346576 RepID=UPI00364AB42B
MRGLRREGESTPAPRASGREAGRPETVERGADERGADERRGQDGTAHDRLTDGLGSDDESPPRRFPRTVTLTATTATGGVALAALIGFGLFVIGCSTSATGTRDEGAASVATVEPFSPPTSEPSALPAQDIDPLALLRGDPKVSGQVKADLKPCAKDAYPVDTSYGNLTGGTAPDVVINVMTCDDAVGLATYVYRESDRHYVNVFVAEEPAVYATIDRGELVVTRQVYAKGDPVSYPSGEDVVTYAWTDTRFAERYRVRNNYSGVVGNGPVDAATPPATSGNDD